MQLPESWLREFCDPSLTSLQLADKLTMSGLEVEQCSPVAPFFRGVVVGEIKECEPHPNADRLHVCKVDVGQSALLNIVCGAANARVGIKVPCALVDAELPREQTEQVSSSNSSNSTHDQSFIRIKLGSLRGIESQGMLCSSKELGINAPGSEGAAQEGLLELASSAVIGQDIRQHLKLDDTIFTIKLTPNLAHCLSIFGVAREVSAITGSPLKKLIPVKSSVNSNNKERLPVKILAPELCGRFSGRIVRDVNFNAPTPAWMIRKLEYCGQRSVNALVDISNYVMLEMGHPTHIFDLDKIKGELQVRWAYPEESLKLLNDSVVTLDESVGVVADDLGATSLAAIMGGEATAVSRSTKHIYIEAAFWHPSGVAGRARRFNLSTESAHRFERGVDPTTTLDSIERITELVLQICGTSDTSVSAIDDQCPNMPPSRALTLRASRAAKVIGMPLSTEDCQKALQSLGLAVAVNSSDRDQLLINPPAYRFDLQIEEDLIEEVVRTIGYDRLPETKPIAPISPMKPLETVRPEFALRRMLAQLGFQETINFSFVSERSETELAGNNNPIFLQNPIASHMNVMRSSLMGSLLNAMKYNQDHRTTQEKGQIRIFEIGRVFAWDASVKESGGSVAGVAQPRRVAGLAAGLREPIQWSTAGGDNKREIDFYDLKADVVALFAPQELLFKPGNHPALHPGRTADIYLENKNIGVIGEIHPKWRQSYDLHSSAVLFEVDLSAALSRNVPKSLNIPKLPAVQRDLAIVVPQAITCEQLIAAIDVLGNKLIQSKVLFDVYRPKDNETSILKDEKSFAIRLFLGQGDVTLTDTQIETAVNDVVSHLASLLGARLR